MVGKSVFFIITLTALWLALLVPSRSLALDSSAQFSIVYGPSVPDADNTNPYKLSGVKGSANLTPSVSLGGYFIVSDNSGDPSATNTFKYSLHGVEVAFHVPVKSGDSYYALRAGLAKVRTNPTGVDLTYSPYHYGFSVGYDYSLSSIFSIGFEGSYMQLFNSKTSYQGTPYELERFNILTFLAVLQARF